ASPCASRSPSRTPTLPRGCRCAASSAPWWHCAMAVREPTAARSRLRTDDGYALLIVLLAMAALAPLGAFAGMQARVDALVQDATRRADEAFYVAEAGLAHAIADLEAAPRFERLRAGPDGRQGTADDDQFPFAAAPPAFFPRQPYRYDVRVVHA